MEEPWDSREIAGLYGELVRPTNSVVVELDRAIAVAEVDVAEAGLALADQLHLDGHQYLLSWRSQALSVSVF
jgi:predicted RNA polymerase sigma factor